MKTISANAICLTCGTTREDSVTGFCKNDHDNWCEVADNMTQIEIAKKALSVDISVILKAIEKGTDLTPCK